MFDLFWSLLRDSIGVLAWKPDGTFQEKIGVVAAWLSIVEVFPLYILAMLGWDVLAFKKLNQPTRPSRTTWSILAIQGLVLAPANVAVGATTTLGVVIWYTIGYLAVAILSIWYGTWDENDDGTLRRGPSRLDTICIVAAIGSGVAGLIWREPMVAIAVPLLVDFFAIAPTIKKCWQSPETEYAPAWTLTFIVSILNVFAIQWGSISTGALMFPAYMLLVNGALVVPFYAKYARRANVFV